jgi:TPR repeat protein
MAHCRASLAAVLAAGASFGFVPSVVAQSAPAKAAVSAAPSEARARAVAGSTVKQIVERFGKGFDLTYSIAKSFNDDLPSWRISAGKNDPNGLLVLGLCNYYGIGGAQNRDRGFEFVQKAADAGSVDAMAILGVMLKNGDLDHAPQPHESGVWFGKALSINRHPIAVHYLALIEATGHWAVGEMDQGNEILATSAQAGNLNAQVELAMSLLTGWMQPIKDKEAIAMLEQAASAGHVGAMIHLANIYADGRYAKFDPRRAGQWIGAAAATGDVTALMTLAQFYEKGVLSEKRAPDLAKPVWRQLEQSSEPMANFALFRRNLNRFAPGESAYHQQVVERAFDVARRGYPEAYVWVARFLREGTKQLPMDKERSRTILQNGVDALEPNSVFEMGLAYRYGQYAPADESKAIPMFIAAAGMRVPQAMTSVALRYAEGRGLPRDLKMAFQCFMAAAFAGDPDAMHSLSSAYLNGYGVEVSAENTEKWAKLAIANGYPDSFFNIYELYRRGIGREANAKEGLAFLREGMLRGGQFCANTLARLLIDGTVVDRDVKTGIEVLESQLRDDRQGQVRMMLAKYYLEGDPVPANPARAMELTRQAAAIGNSDAWLMLGYAYAFGVNGLEKNWGEAVDCYSKAISLGNSKAMQDLGNHYLRGEVTKRDPEHAIELWTDAANHGNVDAMYALARLYFGDVDPTLANETEALRWTELCLSNKDPRICAFAGQYYSRQNDFVSARTWIQRGIEMGNTDCYNELGVLYRFGRGVEQNFDEAAKNYRLAFEAGNMTGAANLAWCYEEGKGVEKDLDQSIRLAMLAADKGEPNAMLFLGRKYVDGIGVAKNFDIGMTWIKKAATAGNTVAQAMVAAAKDKGLTN